MNNIDEEKDFKISSTILSNPSSITYQHAKIGKLSFGETLTKKTLFLLTKVTSRKYFLAVTSMLREELTPNHQPLLHP